MKKSDLKKWPIGTIFHLDYNGIIYKYIKIDDSFIRRITVSSRYGVFLNYDMTSDFKKRKNSIFVDNWSFEDGYIKVAKIEKPTQYDVIEME